MTATAVPPTTGDPMLRMGLRAFLGLEGRDVFAVVGLVLLAFVLRFASPVVIDVGGSGPVASFRFTQPAGINPTGSGGGPTIAIAGEGYPWNGPLANSPNSGECADVPVPPAAAPASPSPKSGSSGAVLRAHVCGFIFDEVYFPVDAASDLHQPAVPYFDPEPPLTKLLMAPPIGLFGFDTWSWRLSTTVFGSLLAGLLYLIALRLRRDRFFATVAGLLVCLDGLAFVESRTGVIDIIAIFFVALVYYCFLLHWQARTHKQWRITLYVLATALGLAFGAKLTALAPAVAVVFLIALRFLEPTLLVLFPSLNRIRGRPDPGPAMWREAATVYRGGRTGPARPAHLQIAQAILAGEAVGSLLLVCGLAYVAWKSVDPSTTIAEGTAVLGAVLFGLGCLVFLWLAGGLRGTSRLHRVAAVTTAAGSSVVLALILWLSTRGLLSGVPITHGDAVGRSAEVLIAVMLAGALAVVGLLAFSPQIRAAFAASAERPLLRRDGWRTLLHYGLAVGLAGLVFMCCWGRYLTVANPDIYHFTDCNPAYPGLTASSTETIDPAVGVKGVVDVPRAIYDVVDSMAAHLKYHSLECHPHAYASQWQTWPVMEHPVLFYFDSAAPLTAGSTTATGDASITNMGNPAIWWIGLFAMIFCAFAMTHGPPAWRLSVLGVGAISLAIMILDFQRAASVAGAANTVRIHLDLLFYVGFLGMAVFGAMAGLSAVVSRRFVPAFIVMGYELGWLMWVQGNADRVLFFYHALGLFLFLVLGLAYSLALLRRKRIQLASRILTLSPVAYAVVGLVIAAFVFFYPIWTGMPMPSADHGMRHWVDGW